MKNQRALVIMGVILAVTAAFGTFVSIRFRDAGQWEPIIPDRVGPWVAQSSPLTADTLEQLGNPHGYGKLYTNPFADHVSVSVISAGPFENYHDPTVCGQGNGFRLTAMKTIALDTEKSARARVMIFRRGEDERLLYYYWAQTRSGGTEPEPRMGTYRDILPRLQTGVDAVIRGDQVCLIRLLAQVPPADKNGAQTQRNLHEIARAAYFSLLPPRKAAL